VSGERVKDLNSFRGNVVKRRQFLKLSLLGSSAFAMSPSASSAGPPQKFKIGMAATTWVSKVPSTASYWDAVQAISSLGIGATEADDSNAHLVSSYGRNAAEFLNRSRKAGVYLAGVFQSLPLHEKDKLPEMQSTIRSVGGFLKSVKAEYIALGWSAPEKLGKNGYTRTSADVNNAVRVMNEIGSLSLEEYGIYIAFHAERDIPKDIVLQVLDQTNPKYVQFCADVGHMTAMGLDVVPVVKKYAARLAVSHWKDFDPKLPGPDYLGDGAKGDFVEVGKGVVDFRGLTELYREIGYNGWVMLELDRTREPSIVASAREMKTFVTYQLKLKFYPPNS
jgi:sugar phosphate isomerase/epimerase